MAEVTGLRSNALPYPVYGAPYGVTYPILDADGDLVTGATGLDAEISKNGDTFADCTNEGTEIATSSGMYYLLLTATELTTDVATIIQKTSSSGAKTTPIVLYPRKLVTLQSGTVGANAADGTTIQLDSNASGLNDYYNGCLVVGTLDGNVEARIIADYVGSTKVCTISPAFVTTPDNNDTYVVYLPEGKQLYDDNTLYWNQLTTVALPLVPTTAGRTLDVTTTGEAGIDWANIGAPTTTQNLSGTTIKTATDVETDTQDIQARLPAALVSGKMDSTVGAYQTGMVPLQPTVATRTLDVTATGAAGVDWGNVENQSTAVNLSATNIDPDQVVASVTGAVGSVTGAVGSVTGNVGGNVTGSVGSVVGSVGSVTGNVGGNVTGSVGSVAGNVGGNVVGSVGSVSGNVDGNVTGTVGSVVGDLGGDVVGDVQGNVAGSVGSVTAVVSADITKINGTTVTGSGVVGDPWGPL